MLPGLNGKLYKYKTFTECFSIKYSKNYLKIVSLVQKLTVGKNVDHVNG